MKIEARDDEHRAQIHRVVLDVDTRMGGLDVPLDRRGQLGRLVMSSVLRTDQLIDTILNIDECEVARGIHFCTALPLILVIALKRLYE